MHTTPAESPQTLPAGLARGCAVLLLLLALAGCDVEPPVNGCVRVAELTPVCGFSNPEDMELLPDGKTLLISQMGDMERATPGSLVLFDTVDGVITRLPQFGTASAINWGSSECQTPPGVALSPHGIDLTQRADGRREILVVNHGGRESVELFELLGAAGNWQLAWRGCVLPPAGTFMNDVAALPDGDFLISHMYPRDASSIAGINLYLIRGLLGFDTGMVLRCSPSGNCKALPGTAAPLPNGIQTDATGSTLYLNAYLAGEVRKIAIADGRLLGTARMLGPDNSQWTAEGTLLVASQIAGLRAMSHCAGLRGGACGAAFEVVELDPVTMSTRTVLAHHGAPMGGATVAQQVGNAIYLGSFVGDRIVRAELTPGNITPAAPPDP